MRELEFIEKAALETPSFKNELFTEKEVQLWYQYRNFSSFWSILKSDSLWATDARFSNDEEEQKFGADIMRGLFPKAMDDDPNEDYIVCFCAEDDKLSQWRGYAAEGGVAIGFAFDSATLFHVVPEEQGSGRLRPPYRKLYVQLGKVCYLEPRHEEEGETEKDFLDRCAKNISYPLGAERHGDAAREEFIRDLRLSAPFIKHGSFWEENEARLVFHNENGNLSCCTRYHETNADGFRRPYIVVKPGDPDYDARRSVVRMWLNDEGGAQTQELLRQLRSKLVNIVSDCYRTEDASPKTDNFCFGCSRRGQKNSSTITNTCRYAIPENMQFLWGIRKDEHSVIISQGRDQKAVFERVYPLVKQFDPSIRVWCEGHLPIRSITVGPCPNQREVEESIRHYCRHVYWLRDVTIKRSKIPFRRTV